MGSVMCCPSCGRPISDCICEPWKISEEEQSVTTEYTNDRQVTQIGGDHYKSDYQHWDWVWDQNLDYFEGNATKYIFRWELKGGAEDIKKAISFIKKLIKFQKPDIEKTMIFQVDAFNRFCECNQVWGLEREICMRIAKWKTTRDLQDILIALECLIASAQGRNSK